MKKRMLLIFMTIILVFFANTETRAKDSESDEKMRGVWVASVLNINYPSVITPNSALLKIEADNIIESASNAGFNAIFLQVRPTADSLYKSEIFPWSKYLTGTEGKAPNNGFDPLAYFIEKAHKKNIEVHAWINPYRITKKRADEPAYTVDMLSENHPARVNPSYVISYDGNLYFDPALEGVRKLILAGIEEIVDNYEVDGIHFDDYFYPSPKFDDSKSYARLGAGSDLGAWRRENVNMLVREVYALVHSKNKELKFGISPFGIWANESSLSEGSSTKGSQSYFDHYADSLYWINNSVIDYITPQVYWHSGFEIADFKILTDWWTEAVKNKDVDLYIGLAAYRANNPDKKSPWHKNYELKNQLAYINEKEEVDGFIAFSMTSIRSSNRIYNAFRGAGEITDKAKFRLPSINLYGGLSKQYVGGLIYPQSDAYLNGKKIESVSDKGFYGILLDANKEKSYRLENAGIVDTKVYKLEGGNSSSWTRKDDSRKYDYLNKVLEKEVLFAKIKNDETNLKADLNPDEGSMELLPKGVMAEIRAAYGSVLELTSGRYIDVSLVDIIHKNNDKYYLNNPVYIVGENEDKIEFNSNIKPFIKPYIEDGRLIMELSGNVYLPELILTDKAVVKSAKKEYINYRSRYVLELHDINDLGGYYVEYEANKIVFNIKRKKNIKDDDKPLENFNIILDAGHGASDTGALGLLGRGYSEKDVNLDITLKLAKRLESLGSNIILTRDKDEYKSLHERLKMVQDKKPDLFISIHANSCGMHRDVTKIQGFSVYYSKDIAEEYAFLAQEQMSRNTACLNSDARMADFYVIRSTHCPSVLLESGFMPNPEDFDWLSDDKKQDEFISELARTVLLYFNN